ncbi:hypothetical protein BJX76DRAFT_234299 [Aspergillus varians]
MADAPQTESPRPQSQEQTPQKPQYQNGVRSNGRAFNSPNWRMKREESPSQSPSQSQSQPQSRDQGSSPGPSPVPRSRIGLGLGLGFGRPREGGVVPQAISEGRRLYVGNMPYTAKMEDVKEVFVKGGFEVSRIDIAIDPLSGRNPSYCFVDLETKELAERAMAELDGSDLIGRPVKIKPGVVKSASERQQQQQQRAATDMSNSDGSNTGSPRVNRTSPFNADRWRRLGEESPSAPSTPTKLSTRMSTSTNASPSASGPADPSKRLYVGGLPRLTEQDDISGKLTEFFKGYTVTNISKLFAPHPAKRFEPGNHYYLFVDFASVEETQNAMAAMNGAEGPWGAGIRVQRARGEVWKESSSEERKPAARWGSSSRGQQEAVVAAVEGAVEA